MSTARTAREPQQGRSRETVERILAAAEHDIGRLGLAAAGTRGIAARAGLSVGALYRFFPDKEAIADALARRYLADLMPAYAGTVADVAPAPTWPAWSPRWSARPRSSSSRTPATTGSPRSSHPSRATPRRTRFASRSSTSSPAHSARPGVGEPEAEVRRVVALCVETVRHALVRGLDPVGRRRGRRAGAHGGSVRPRPVRLTRNFAGCKSAHDVQLCYCTSTRGKDMTQTDGQIGAELDRIERSMTSTPARRRCGR